MSGDRFESLIADGVDRIALPPESEWLPDPSRAAPRHLRPSRLVFVPLLAAVIVLAAVLGAGLRTVREQPPASQPPAVPVVVPTPLSAATPSARCSDGRPQSEIDFAGRMLWEPTATEISCVLNATVSGPGANRAYRLTDGRVLNMYERVETLPVKPWAVPIATGTAEVSGATWSWSTLPAGPRQTLLLQGSLAGAPYIELSMDLSDQVADLRLLRSIAASLRQVPAATVAPNPGGTTWQQLRRALPAGVPVIEPTWLPLVLTGAAIDSDVSISIDPAKTTYTLTYHHSGGRERVTFTLGPAVPATPSRVGTSGIGMTVRRSPAALTFPSDLFAHPGADGLRVLSWTEGAYTLSISSETISGDDLLHIAWSLDQTGAPGAALSARAKPGVCADAASPETTARQLIALLGSRDRDALADCFASEAAGYAAGWTALPAATLDSLRSIDGAGGRAQLQVAWTFASDPGGPWNPRPTNFFLIGQEDGFWRVFAANTAPFPKAP